MERRRNAISEEGGRQMNEVTKGLITYDLLEIALILAIIAVIVIVGLIGRAGGKTISKMQKRLWGTDEEETENEDDIRKSD